MAHRCKHARGICAAVLALMAAAATTMPAAAAVPARTAAPGVRGVVIDPADYQAEFRDPAVLARKLAEDAARYGVNTIYLNAYNVEYGAYYRTTYLYNRESEYGKADLLGKLISAAHSRGVKIYAALYDHQHRGAWEFHPEWRAMRQNGSYYNPPRTDVQYYLSVGHPSATAWWRGFLADMMTNYPDLDGFELREPIVNWWGTEADHNPAVTRAFLRAHPRSAVGGTTWRVFRQQMLTRFLKSEIAQIHAARKQAHVTTVADTGASGHLMPAKDEAFETGFDLDGLITGKDRPDAIKVELIWQQWARNYDYITFTPEWTGRAVREFFKQVRDRVPVITHVELTDFGRHVMTPQEFYRTLVAARQPGVGGLDFYSAFLADGKNAWPAISSVYRATGAPVAPEQLPTDQRALILYDDATGKRGATPELSKLRAIYLANLLGHFDVKWELRPIDEYERGSLGAYRYVFYEGTVYANAPIAFVSDVSVYDGTVVWIGQNLFELAADGVRLPFVQRSQKLQTGPTTVTYNGTMLPANGEYLSTTALQGAQTVATLNTTAGNVPYILRAKNFWYVTGSPFSQLDRTNGRYLAFADQLHEMLGKPAAASHRAYARLEDIDPLTDPQQLERLADAFAARKVPFVVSVIPFFVDPAKSTRVSLSDRPRLVKALKYAVTKGGALILHGSSHQYKGRTGIDFEFWNSAAASGVAEDGEDYVRAKITAALNEMWKNGLHPIAWETPHYAATPFDYSLFGEYFSTFLERRTYGVWRGRAYQQALPYEVQADVFGAHVLPENLGFISQAGDAATIVENARALLVVRDSMAGAFFHRNIPPVVVGSVMDQLFALGYSFVDLYSLPNTVTTPERVELTGFGWATVTVPSEQYLQERLYSRAGALKRSTATYEPGYVRVTRSWDDVPSNGLYVLRAVARPDQGDRTGTTLPRLSVIGSFMLLVVLGFAALGLLVLVGSYAGIKVRAR